MTEKVKKDPRQEPGRHFRILSPPHPEGSLTSPSFPQETGGGKKEHDMKDGKEEVRDMLSQSPLLFSRWHSPFPAILSLFGVPLVLTMAGWSRPAL